MLQNARHNALFLLHKGQGQMFRIRLLMAHARGEGLGLGHGLAGFFRKFVDVHTLSTQCRTDPAYIFSRRNPYSSKPCKLRTLRSRASMRSSRSTMMTPPTTGSSKSQQMRSSLRTL